MAERKRKYSRKREAIRAALCETKTHPSAEWIYAKLKPEMPDLSLATVYRNLGEMKQNGEIQSVAFVGGKERFDGCTAQHPHFICDVCGRIDDIEGDALPDLSDAISKMQVNGQINYHSLTFYGVCKNCMH